MFINLLESVERIENLDYLIRIEKTGGPNDLAENLNLSERQIFRLIELMRNLGAEIVFCRYKQTYKYVKPVKFRFGFIEA